ncbi:MAG: transcription termination/antitermination NusG family protein [Verrucomicrobiota bacterium]
MGSQHLSYSPVQLALVETPLWFCLRAQPKREHLAATALRRQLQIECFSPRLRFRKMTRRGAVWFVEAMFPGYLFARFVYAEQHRWVGHSHGILSIVQFGGRVATLDSNVIVDLRKNAGDEETVTIDPEIQVGQSVRITEGPFQGLEALVTCLMPAKERVRLLLGFLGRSLETEISMPKVLSVASPRNQL